MKNKRRWALGTLIFLALIAIVGWIVLPRLVDAETYRGMLRSSLERQLGRPVEFGAMDLSLWPVFGLRLDDLSIGRTPTERFDEPLTAKSLRVGARLFPLLGGRLEVTSLAVERGSLSLYRNDEGVWEPTLTPQREAGATQPPDDSVLIIERLSVRRSRVVLRSGDAGRLRETTLEDLSVDLEGLGTGGPLSFDVTTNADGLAPLRVDGTLYPAGEVAERQPLRLLARVDSANVAPSLLGDWMLTLAPTMALPEELIEERPFSASATIEYIQSDPASVAISDAKLRGIGLRLLRSPAGVWNYAAWVESAAPEEQAAPSQDIVFTLTGATVEDASLRVSDRAFGRAPSALDLTALRLSLDRFPTSGPAALEVDAQVGGSKDARLTLRGKLGPVGAKPAATPLDLSLRLVAIPLGDAQFLLPASQNLDLSSATVTADLRSTGTFSRELSVRGDVTLSGAIASFVPPQGDPRRLPFDLLAHADVTLRDSASLLELTKLELELPREDANSTLKLRGTVNAQADPPRIDIELLPTRVVANDLAALAAILAPDAPLSFASPDPVELQLRAHGPLGGGTLPDLDGAATLSGLTFLFAGMTQPMEQVGARVTFSPNRLALEGLGGIIGKSQVAASSVVVTNFAAPRVQLDVNAPNADFWELFSFIKPGTTPEASGEDLLSLATVEGTLRIAKGSLQTLTFESLTTEMEFRAGVLTLAPLEMSLYGGRFSGQLVQDLNAGVLTIRGNGVEVDADGFLKNNMALGGLLSGRASTDLDVRVRATDPANLVAGVSGGGPLRLVDGRLEKLQILTPLSKVTGIFGEHSLRRVTQQLATAGTPFSRAETRLSFDSGTLSFKDLVIETADLTLAGNAALESATGKLDGRFAVVFSPELSATMRDEQSRAARLFWDPEIQRVRFGFDVAGPATAPSVRIDWDGALRGIVDRKLGDKLRDLIPHQTPATPPSSITREEPSPPTSEAAPTDTGPTVEITRTRWTGPVLLRDLSIEGNVHGAGLDRVSLLVVDARGNAVETVDRLPGVEGQLAAAVDREAPATVAWSFKVDGKRLVAARFPVTVTATVHDRHGSSVATTQEVTR